MMALIPITDPVEHANVMNKLLKNFTTDVFFKSLVYNKEYKFIINLFECKEVRTNSKWISSYLKFPAVSLDTYPEIFIFDNDYCHISIPLISFRQQLHYNLRMNGISPSHVDYKLNNYMGELVMMRLNKKAMKIIEMKIDIVPKSDKLRMQDKYPAFMDEK